MVFIRRPTYAVSLFFIIAAAFVTVPAQEMRERELRPASDMSQIKSPVEIVSMRLNGKEIQPGEKIMGDDEWLRGLSFTLKNVSDKPVAYVSIGFRYHLPGRVVVYRLAHGIDLAHGETRKPAWRPAIQPGESFNLVLTSREYKILLHVLAQGGVSSSFDVAQYYIEKWSFENEPNN